MRRACSFITIVQSTIASAPAVSAQIFAILSHSRSQSFDPFGQRQGSISIPFADQKDRSCGNENDFEPEVSAPFLSVEKFL